MILAGGRSRISRMSAISRLLARFTTPPTSPISKSLTVGVVCHLPPDPFFPILADIGVGLVTIDGIPDWDAQERAIRAAKAAGLKVWAGVGTGSWKQETSIPDLDGYVARVAAWWERMGGLIDYASGWNEPNLKRFWTGPIEDLAVVYWTNAMYRDRHAPGVKIIEPNFSTLGSSARVPWQEFMSRFVQLDLHETWDITGFHVYEDTPSATWNTAREVVAYLNKLGIRTPYALGEVGYHSRGRLFASEESQARFLVKTLSDLSLAGHGVEIAQIYELADVPGGGYGIYTSRLGPKLVIRRLRQSLDQ